MKNLVYNYVFFDHKKHLDSINIETLPDNPIMSIIYLNFKDAFSIFHFENFYSYIEKPEEELQTAPIKIVKISRR